jgi:hypothetical protein
MIMNDFRFSFEVFCTASSQINKGLIREFLEITDSNEPLESAVLCRLFI